MFLHAFCFDLLWGKINVCTFSGWFQQQQCQETPIFIFALYYFTNPTFHLFAEVNGKQNFKDGNSSIHFKVLDTSGEWMLLGGR